MLMTLMPCQKAICIAVSHVPLGGQQAPAYEVDALAVSIACAPWICAAALERSRNHRYNTPQRNKAGETKSQMSVTIRCGDVHKQ